MCAAGLLASVVGSVTQSEGACWFNLNTSFSMAAPNDERCLPFREARDVELIRTGRKEGRGKNGGGGEHIISGG